MLIKFRILLKEKLLLFCNRIELTLILLVKFSPLNPKLTIYSRLNLTWLMMICWNSLKLNWLRIMMETISRWVLLRLSLKRNKYSYKYKFEIIFHSYLNAINEDKTNVIYKIQNWYYKLFISGMKMKIVDNIPFLI